jgi:hypothetical protein
MPNTVGCLPACASCIQSFEEADAPEELAITLGDKLSPLEEAELYAGQQGGLVHPSLTEEIFGGIYYR